MHPFDFVKDVVTVTGQMSDYLSFINHTYFPICKDKRVLEIGPGSGLHTRRLVEHCPSYIEVIEADARHLQVLEKIPSINKIIHNDVIVELTENPKNFDVCICLGLLYHLHSPLYLLELMINKCQPKYILLDCVTAPHPLAFLPEPINTLGNCQTNSYWKSCKLNFVVPFFIYNEALHNMNYQLQSANKQTISWFPKSNGWTALWKLME